MSLRERLGLWLLRGTQVQVDSATAQSAIEDIDAAVRHLNDLRMRLARVEAGVILDELSHEEVRRDARE